MNAIQYTLQLLFLLFFQIFVFQKIYLTPYCVPFFYSMLIFTLPVFTNKYIVLLLGFAIGYLMDGFYHTGGIHTGALTLIAYLRYYWLKIIEPPERYEENQIPVVSQMGRNWFLKYITPLVLLHHFTLFLIEAFELRYAGMILIKSILSTLLSIGLIYYFHLIFFRPKSQ